MSSRVQSLAAHLTAASSSTQAPSTQTKVFGQIGKKSDDDIVIVDACRTAIGKANKGVFKDTTPDDLLCAALVGLIGRTGINPAIISDVVVGNCQMPGSYAGPSRAVQFRSGLSVTSGVHTLNRQCSSGLQAVATVASYIESGFLSVGVAAGVESMTFGGKVDVGSGAPFNKEATAASKLASDTLISMGQTSENVAERYGVSREHQDAFAVASHDKALKAQKQGVFAREIVPVKLANGTLVTVDEGPRAGTTVQGLSKLKPAFKEGGSTTAGNASQVSDGASAVLLMKRSTAKAMRLPVLGTFRGFKVEGCEPDEMGVGPAVAIPSLLKDVALDIQKVDVFEINEAFASQALYCTRKLGIPLEKVNPNGGAIALGHPLGCTGNRQVATLLWELRRTGQKLGVVSMCIGTGMGAAALFETE